MIQAMATAYATGHLKQDSWTSFLNGIFKNQDIDVDKTIKDMKKAGFDVEEG